MKEGVMTKDTSREAAVAALVICSDSQLWQGEADSMLDAILANPAHRKALLAVMPEYQRLLKVEAAARDLIEEPNHSRIYEHWAFPQPEWDALRIALAADGAET